jgi:hypothetical protein
MDKRNQRLCPLPVTWDRGHTPAFRTKPSHCRSKAQFSGGSLDMHRNQPVYLEDMLMNSCIERRLARCAVRNGQLPRRGVL